MLSSDFKIPPDLKISVPGDKSISHRSVLFSSLAKGVSKISGFLEAEDPLNTMKCFSKMGVQFEKKSSTEYIVKSPGKEHLVSPKNELDFGNGGTGIRLSAGLICGLDGIDAVLTGDESLKKRPMKRIIEPLSQMGASIQSISGDGTAPLRIHGTRLKDFSYKSPIASAQVKSCLMLGAISSNVSLTYEEDELSRDHTENMVKFLGGKILHESKTKFTLSPPFDFSGTDFLIPGDISSAAFFIVLGLVSKDSTLTIQNIGLNESRIGVISILRNMGGKIIIENEKMKCGEKTGDLKIFSSELKKVEISGSVIPSVIDEIPILTIAGLFSKGGFEISGAEDLRAKESDRIYSMVKNLRAIGVETEEKQDGYGFGEVESIQPAMIESFMDHRIAMSFSILKTLLNNEIEIDDDSWIDTSFPEFKKNLKIVKQEI